MPNMNDISIEQQAFRTALREILHTQSLLLQMVSDIYEVAQSLGAKVGVQVQPCAQVKTWLKERENT